MQDYLEKAYERARKTDLENRRFHAEMQRVDLINKAVSITLATYAGNQAVLACAGISINQPSTNHQPIGGTMSDEDSAMCRFLSQFKAEDCYLVQTGKIQHAETLGDAIRLGLARIFPQERLTCYQYYQCTLKGRLFLKKINKQSINWGKYEERNSS